MHPLEAFSADLRQAVRVVLADIDDTLSTNGEITAEAYGALEDLKNAGFLVVPVTGRPAGWCDHIARMWPVHAVVGENGAFYFQNTSNGEQMTRRFVRDPDTRQADRQRLEELKQAILKAIPGAGIASDQPYRESDLAIDFREDVSPLPDAAIDQIVSMFKAGGATARVSSIHVNGWFGDHDKLSTTRLALKECFHIDIDTDAGNRACVFIGDSPNDAPMFDFFHHSVGVANIRHFANRLDPLPTFVTRSEAGAGFAELSATLLETGPGATPPGLA